MNESKPRRGPITFRCFDLETTGVDVETCEVVQAAVVSARGLTSKFDAATAASTTRLSHEDTQYAQLFAARDVPPESTAVHRITDRDPERFPFPVTVIPDDAPPFIACVRSMVSSLAEPDVVSVSFNGCGYDIPIVARYYVKAAAASVRMTVDEAATALRARHIDVMRLWLRAKQSAINPPWTSVNERVDGLLMPLLTADMFAGSLTAAHGFYLGHGFGGAHDAGVDCRATLAVLDAMLRSGFVTVEQAIAWSNAPLPGDVDFDGKFKWHGDQAVIGFGKHANTPLERLPSSYLRWMVDADFGADTKAVIRRYLAGEYPQRAYESE